MAATMLTVSTVEAAFLADLPQRKINQVVDDDILPARLYQASSRARRFMPVAAALAKFYFGAEKVMAAHARKQVMAELVKRIHALPPAQTRQILALASAGAETTWHVQPLDCVDVNLAGFVRQAMERFHVLQLVNDAIDSTPDIMQGAAVFKGSRVPVGLVLGFLRQGDTLEALKQDYPFLTPELIELARVYEALHPQRGRPRTLARQFPAWQVEHKAIRPGAHA